MFMTKSVLFLTSCSTLHIFQEYLMESYRLHKDFMRGHKIHLCLKSPDIPDSPTSTSLTFQFNSLWFYLISSYQLLGMPVSLPSNLHTSEMSVCPFSQLFCYWFFLVFHSFWLLYYSNLFICSFNFLALFLNISCIFFVCASIHFLRYRYQSIFIINQSLLSLLWVFLR